MDELSRELVELAKENSALLMTTNAGLIALLTSMRVSGSLDCETFTKELKHLIDGPLANQVARSETARNAVQAMLNIAGAGD